MRKIFVFFALAFLAVSFASAQIIVTQQPGKIYNYGDLVSVPFLVKTVSGVSGTLGMSILCDGREFNFYKNGVKLLPGEQKSIDAGVFLDSQISTGSSASCVIRASLGEEYAVTDEFSVSNSMEIKLSTNKTSFAPQESAQIEGKAVKANGQPVDGFIDITFVNENSSESFNYSNAITNGFFSVTFVLPKNTPAGRYLLQMLAYEKDSSNQIINSGDFGMTIGVEQVPTSLEIVFENSTVEPGNSMKVKAVLRDQTGEKIDSSAVISVKDSLNKLREQQEKSTDVFLEMQTAYDEAPAVWTVVATSGVLTSQSTFDITRKETVDVKIVNSTLIVTNTGNVPYNQSLLVKIGSGTIDLPVSLGVDESKKYSLTAPDGDYKVEVINNGQTKAFGSTSLTGNAIGVREYSGHFSLTGYPFAWIFVILVLGFMFIMLIRKGFKQSFTGRVPEFRRNGEPVSVSKNLPIFRRGFALRSKTKAEVSVSLRGDKEAASVVAIKIRNGEAMKNPESEKILQNIIDFAESNKAIVHISEGCDNIIFLLAPTMTKTYANEKSAISVANHAKGSIDRYNKLARDKMDFGISLNYGDIVIKREGTLFKFMSFGSLVNNSKKMASLSKGEVLATEEMRDRILKDMTVEKKEVNGTNAYTIRESKFNNNDATKKFIEGFKRRNQQ